MVLHLIQKKIILSSEYKVSQLGVKRSRLENTEGLIAMVIIFALASFIGEETIREGLKI